MSIFSARKVPCCRLLLPRIDLRQHAPNQGAAVFVSVLSQLAYRGHIKRSEKDILPCHSPKNGGSL
ncbi:hypothetical protein AtDm6_3430 [Acetobacter tropicalis]|uniref:Uncharacterized protein n=1 Tax=Acetobacter tropicalis TaxID=104102 RepID=A0A094YHN3_9PROT|nr:hypothetical protein AtDm6_3430 [Acetobacter tropicalis]